MIDADVADERADTDHAIEEFWKGMPTPLDSPRYLSVQGSGVAAVVALVQAGVKTGVRFEGKIVTRQSRPAILAVEAVPEQ